VEQFATSLYEELFEDEAHLLLIFFEYKDGTYSIWYYAGSQARAVIDAEAADILLEYIYRYADGYNLSAEEIFSKAFNDAAKRIMKVTVPPWVPVLSGLSILIILILW